MGYEVGGTVADQIAVLAKRVTDLEAAVAANTKEIKDVDTKHDNYADQLMQMLDSYQAGNTEMFNNLNNLYIELADTCAKTTTTPPTADGTGLPAFVVLDKKPETEYKNYVYIYPRG